MKNASCPFCNFQGEFTKTVVKSYKYWRVELHTSQSYLGRCAIILNRHLEDFFDINTEEREELFEISKHLRESIKTTFNASMLNYATLGNIVRHVHLHVIPRYEKPVTFAGVTFTDQRWGQNYAPYNKEFKIPNEVYMKIKEAILNNLGRNN